MRNIAYRRHHTKRIQKKKLRIIKDTWYNDNVPDELLTDKFIGKLDKGKVHCSCWMCSIKSNTHGYKDKEQALMDSLDSEMKGYI